ncbi:MAG TPA: NAD(P)H-dependent oxidoreductase [Steroidobacteraceae bacterium]|nr:NAD(P)H-dependent oxidoreductase [Steroidobacteraceae bacterium]
MTEKLDVVALIGSLRRGSYTRQFVHALIKLAEPTRLRIEIVEIGGLPLYNQDDEEHPPAPWVEFRSRVQRANAVLFATPEYNRTIPGGLKNAIDVGSRPYGKSVWQGKPAAVISTSPGAMGAFGANHCLRQSLVFLDMPALQQPEAYIGGVDKLVNAAGEITIPATREFCEKILRSFESWVRLTGDSGARGL